MNVVVLLMLSLNVLVCLLFIHFSIHRIPEGSIGIYWKCGKLDAIYTVPGYHFKLPYFTQVETIQTTLKTSIVRDIPCGTISGVMLHFEKIEIVHQLEVKHAIDLVRKYGLTFEKLWIEDRVHHEINQMCSQWTLHQIYISKFQDLDESLVRRLSEILKQWAPAINLISVRLTKPAIPKKIRTLYEHIDEHTTKLLIATEKQQTVLKAAETARQKEFRRAEQKLAVSLMTNEKMEEEKAQQFEIALLEDKTFLDREKATADAWLYRALKEAAALRNKLTPKYLELLRSTALSKNLVVYYGNRIPSAFVDISVARHQNSTHA